MILAPTNRRIIRPGDKPSFEHTQRYGLIKGHWANTNRVGLWLFNEGSGGQVFDLSGHGFDFTTINGTPFWTGGMGGPAMRFESDAGTPANGDYIYMAKPVITTPPFTIIVWFKSHTDANTHLLFWVGSTTDNDEWLGLAAYDGPGIINFYRHQYDVSGRSDSISTTVNWVAGKWNMAVATMVSETNFSVFLNGGNKATEAAGKETTMKNHTHTCIGAMLDTSPQYWLDSDIALACAWDVVLTDSQIALLYREPFLGIEKRMAPVYFFVPAGVDVTVEPATQELALTQHAPVVSIDCTVPPATLELALTQHAPDIITGVIVAPSTLELELALHAPSIIIDVIVSPATLALALTQHAPTIVISGDVTILPDVLALETALHAPEVITSWADIPPLMHKALIDPYSGGAWMWLCRILVPGYAAIRLAKNTEDVTYGGEVYEKWSVEIGKQTFAGDGSIPRIALRVAQDSDKALEKIVNATKGCHQGTIKLMRVHEDFLDYEIEALETNYGILNADSDWEWVYFTLGIPNLLTQKIPLRIGSSKVCPWALPELFKGPRCQYSGSETSCTGTIEDCRDNKNNAVHWGAELGLDPNVARA